MREGGAERDALLLAAGQLRGCASAGPPGRPARAARCARRCARDARPRARAEPDELTGGQLGRERLVCSADPRSRADGFGSGRAPAAQAPEVDAGDAHGPAEGRSRPASILSSVVFPEPLGPRTATTRPGERQAQSLKRRRGPLVGRVHAEDVSTSIASITPAPGRGLLAEGRPRQQRQTTAAATTNSARPSRSGASRARARAAGRASSSSRSR